MVRFGVGLTCLWAAASVVVGAPVRLATRDVTSDVLQQLSLFEQYSAASYCTNNVNSTGDKLTCEAGNCPDVQSADTKTLYEFSDSGDYGDVTGFLAADTTNNLLVVSFRGSRSFENWVANLDFPLESVDLCDGCKAHNGFWEAWQAVADELSTNLNSAIKEYSGYKVVFTGHSFGGAMATLGATALRNNGVDIDLYTLGSPRVGDKALAEYIANQGTLYRITHTNDIVPKLPPEDLGFSHPGPEYWITSDNDKTVGTGDIQVLQGLDSSDGNAGSDGTSISAHLWYFNGIADCS